MLARVFSYDFLWRRPVDGPDPQAQAGLSSRSAAFPEVACAMHRSVCFAAFLVLMPAYLLLAVAAADPLPDRSAFMTQRMPYAAS